MIAILFVLFILFTILWALFIRGVLFKGILAVFGFIGVRAFLLTNIPASHQEVMNILGCSITWAGFIPTLLILLALATTRSD